MHLCPCCALVQAADELRYRRRNEEQQQTMLDLAPSTYPTVRLAAYPVPLLGPVLGPVPRRAAPLCTPRGQTADVGTADFLQHTSCMTWHGRVSFVGRDVHEATRGDAHLLVYITHEVPRLLW